MRRRVMRSLALLGSALAAAPVAAQDHSDHAQHAPAPVPAPSPDPGHGAMDHSSDQSGDADVSPGPTMETPPPPEAGSGPPRAADAIWGAETMAAERHREHAAHGDFPVLWVQADRLEARMQDGANGFLWDVQGYYGGPTSRLWFKSEGEGTFGEEVEEAEVQVLWARAIDPYWDLQIGLRQDFSGPATTHAVIGVQGLAPYDFDVDAALFVSHRGDVTARIEAEIDQRITQRLILQPRAELSVSAQDIPGLGIGAGLDRAELGVRLRYEIVREFAPYIGVERSWRFGGSAGYARAAGEAPHATSVVAGVRFWF